MEQSISVTAARFQHRDLSILVGILSGTLLVVFASENPLSNFQPIDLVIFFAVPALAGAIAGFTSAGRSMENGAVVGVVIGLVYAILNGLRLGSSAAGEQVLFLLLTVPIWGFLGAMARFWRSGRWRAPLSRVPFCHGRRTLHELDPCKGLRCATTARQLILPTRCSVRAAEQNWPRSPPAPNYSS